MATVQDLIREISSIKKTSEDLSSMVGLANTNLANESSRIATFVQGSRTGQEAVMSLSLATRALANAASSMKALDRTCDECIRNLQK